MSIRTAVVLALAATVVAGGAAGAAPKAKVKPVCNLFTDQAGDGTGFLLTDQNYLPNDPQLDIVSGDVASDGKQITAVLRLSALDKTDSNAPTGRTYYVNFGIADVELNLSAAVDQDGVATFQAGYQDTAGRAGLGAVTGVLDTAKKEVRITAPLSIFAEKLPLKAGTKLEYVEGLAQRYVGNRTVGRGITPSADATDPGSSYTIGAPSCVAVGK
ncbi:MAG: hypothetical protein JWN77_208 [Frankiales bacterium]|jgi:hypothetical protein|nr:hypothetical protein [Frankiales bacterium]